jgi:small subunit ribosomal protein S13
MTQIFDIQVPSNQTIQQAIINIHGIGRNRSEQFCQYIGLPRSTTLGSLSLKKRNWITNEFENFITHWQIIIDVELRQRNNLAMTTLRGINSYRGVRNAQGLPVRGQSSKSNAKTQRKRRRIAVAQIQDTKSKKR